MGENANHLHIFERKCDAAQIAKRSRLYVARTFEKEKIIGFPKIGGRISSVRTLSVPGNVVTPPLFCKKRGGLGGLPPGVPTNPRKALTARYGSALCPIVPILL